MHKLHLKAEHPFDLEWLQYHNQAMEYILLVAFIIPVVTVLKINPARSFPHFLQN